MNFLTVRESRTDDTPFISEVVRQAYLSNVGNAFRSALFNEATYQAMILLAAFLFIFVGVPLYLCVLSIPMVFVIIYMLIYGSILMKAAEITYSKRPLACWVAEVYEPYICEKPQNFSYKLITQQEIHNISSYRKKIVGTCSVMKHNLSEDWVWLFKLAVDDKYRRKGIGMSLIRAAQEWSKSQGYSYIELVATECQDDARQVFRNAGFDVKQLYHKRLFTGAFTIQMFQLRCEARSSLFRYNDVPGQYVVNTKS